MYLMFELRRLDVWPIDDLGVRRGYGLAWQVDPAPSAKGSLRRSAIDSARTAPPSRVIAGKQSDRSMFWAE